MHLYWIPIWATYPALHSLIDFTALAVWPACIMLLFWIQVNCDFSAYHKTLLVVLITVTDVLPLLASKGIYAWLFSFQMKLYHSVIEDVISGVRDSFLDEGVDEQVLQELKQIWETKLLSSKALELNPEPPEPQPPQIGNQKDGRSNVSGKSGLYLNVYRVFAKWMNVPTPAIRKTSWQLLSYRWQLHGLSGVFSNRLTTLKYRAEEI